MRVNKGINKDVREQDLPEGMSVEARNIVYDKIGSITNEKGFDLFYDNPEDKTVVGIINHSEGTSIIFSVYATGVSEIGVLKETSNPKYQPRVKDTVGNLLFNFNIDYPITGEIEKNSLGEFVVIFTGTNGDETIDVPRIVNVDRLPFEVNANKEITEPEKFGQTQLFLNRGVPSIDLLEVKDSGGLLETGAYYMTLRYVTSEGSFTSPTPITNPIYVNEDSKGLFPEYDGAVFGTSSNKSIVININNLDTNYDFIQIGVVKLIGQTTFAFFVDIDIPIPPSSFLEFTYTGKDTEVQVPLSDVLVPPPVYTGVHTMTQLNRRLYIGNLKIETPLDYQIQANNISLKWITKSVGLDSVKDSYKNEVVSFYDKSFMPDEIYAFYIYFYLKSGGISPAYHIPGRVANVGDTEPSEDTSILRAFPDAKKFEFEDTSTANGDFGYHENSLEVYPNVPEFNGTFLEGQKVRHHKFPTLRTMAERDSNLGNVPDADSNTSDKLIIRFKGTQGDPTGTQGGGFSERWILFKDWTVPSSIGNNVNAFQSNVPLRDGGDFTAPDDPSYDGKEKQFTSTSNQLLQLSIECEFKIDSRVFHAVNPLGVVLEYPGINNDTNAHEYVFEVGIIKAEGGTTIIYNQEGGLEVDSPLGFDEISTTINVSINTSIYLKVGDIFYIKGYAKIDVIRSLLGLWSGDKPGDIKEREATSTQQFVFPEPDPITGEIADSQYTMPILGFEASNVVIPSELEDKIQGYGFAYATRDLSNLTVLGQSLLLPENLQNDLQVDETTRYHAFEMLDARPSPSPDYILPSLVYNKNNGGYSALSSTVPSIIKVDENTNSTYVPTNNVAVDNGNREEHIRTKIDLEAPITGLNGNIIADYKLVNSNIYAPFTSANLTLTGKIIRLEDHTGDVTDIYGGDTFRELYGTRIFSGQDLNNLYFPAVFSKFHIGFRHEGMGIFQKYFPRSIIPYDFGYDLKEFWDDNSDYIGYNRDYDSSNNLIAVVPDTFKPSPVRFPYRVARSVIVPKEETNLLWRNFLALDYYEMPRNRGVVWNLQGYQETNLLIHCTEMLYTTYSNEVLAQDNIEVVLGTGDIFARPPREILPADKGYAGTTSQFSAHLNKLGYTFIDEKRGKVFILSIGGKLDLSEISSMGLKDWFRDNLAIENNFENPTDNPFGGKGYTMQLDEEEDRLLVTKLDGNNSFTRSLDITDRVWVAYHDYIPNYYFFLNNNIYTLGQKQIFKINSNDNRGVYFPDSQPLEEDGITIKPFESYIDVVFNTQTADNKVFYSINWVSDVLNSDNYPMFNETISNIWVYNNYQSSLKFDIVRLKNARRTGGKWSFNEMLDIVSADSRNTLQKFLIESPTLVDLDTTNINNNMSWFNKKRFIHNYITVRFSFNNKDNKKLALHEVFANMRNQQFR